MNFVNQLVEFLNQAIFNAIDNFSSLVGLIISVFVLIKIKKIESNYNVRIRIPSLIAKVENHASTLIKLMDDYPDQVNDIKLELAATGADLESLAQKVDRPTKKGVRAIIQRISRFAITSNAGTIGRRTAILIRVGLAQNKLADYEELVGEHKRNEVYDIYTEVKTLLVRLENIQQDKMLE